MSVHRPGNRHTAFTTGMGSGAHSSEGPELDANHDQAHRRPRRGWRPGHWQAGSRGVVSWATLAGGGSEHVKLSVQLTAPVDFAVSWLFDRAQTAGALQAVSAGCLVAIATPEQLDDLAGRSLANALNTLPTIAATPLEYGRGELGEAIRSTMVNGPRALCRRWVEIHTAEAIRSWTTGQRAELIFVGDGRAVALPSGWCSCRICATSWTCPTMPPGRLGLWPNTWVSWCGPLRRARPARCGQRRCDAGAVPGTGRAQGA